MNDRQRLCNFPKILSNLYNIKDFFSMLFTRSTIELRFIGTCVLNLNCFRRLDNDQAY